MAPTKTDRPQVLTSSEVIRDGLGVVRRGWSVVVVAALIGAAGGFGYSSLQTPEYSSSATLYVTSGTDDNTSSAYQGSLASQQRVSSYARLVNSDAVVAQALSSTRLPLTQQDARSEVSAAAAADTVLLVVSATDKKREVAASLANAVANAMISYVQKLETPAGGGQPLAKLTLVTPATPSGSPVTPKTARNSALGLVLGIAIGLVAVLARARFTNRIRVEGDLQSAFEASVLASIPADRLLTKQGLIDFKRGSSPASEGYRKLRTNLTFANVDKPPRVILVTSATAVEGKTTTAMNLAAALVEADCRVVLVDADLRRPQVDARSGLVGEIGFTNFLRGDGELSDLVQPSQLEGLWVLASGPTPPNPAELLATKRAGQALAELASSFDYVVVDSPPVLPVTDAVVLSQWVDGVVLVARSGSTKIGDLVDASSQVLSTQAQVLGFVLTEAPSDKSRYGYYAVKPKRAKSFFGRRNEPKAIEQVLEPKHAPKH